MEGNLLGYLELGKTSPQDVNSLKPTFVVVLSFSLWDTQDPPFPGIHRAWTLVFLLRKNGAAQVQCLETFLFIPGEDLGLLASWGRSQRDHPAKLRSVSRVRM